MNEFTVIFLVLLAISVIVKYVLSLRQLNAVVRHRDSVPADFRDRITLTSHQKAADYNAAKEKFEKIELVVMALLLLGWTLGGGLQFLDNLWRTFALHPIASGVGFILSTFLLMGVLDLPFSIYRTFVIEQRFGFNRTTAALYASDLIKQCILALVLGAPLAALILWLMARAGTSWWLYGWIVWTLFSCLMLWAYPSLIAPLFNKFTPLDDPALRERITALLQRCGFTSKGIFVMDGSRRSGHGNAYFTGFGTNKRIVFFDTLLSTLQPDEIEAVLAHELGHFKHGHVYKRLILMTVISLAGFAILGWLAQQDWFYHGLGVTTPSNHAALILFLLVMPLFTLPLEPILSGWSRKHEFEADDYAAAQSAPRYLITALVKLYNDNAATLTPDPWHSAFHDTHPPAAIRIAMLQAKNTPVAAGT